MCRKGRTPVFTLTRSGPVADTLTVSVAIEESGTMLAGTSPASMVFAGGVAAVELAVSTVDDDTQESDSAVTVRVVAGTGYGPSADLASATATVLDDDTASTVSAAETLWSADMQVAEITSVSIGAARADLFSNQGGSAGLQAKELWYYKTGRTLKLKFTGAIPEREGLTLHMGARALALPAGSGGEWGATWTGVDIDWTADQTLSVRLTAQSVDAVPADASLKSLTVSGAELSPGFDPGELVYRAVVGSGTESVTVSAAANDGSATLAIEPEVDADPDSADHQVTVPFGETLIGVTVTAEDDETQRRYRVVAIRAAPVLTVSFGSASYTVTEGGDAAAAAVVLSGDPGREVTIPLTAVPGGGADADDYAAPASVTFESGGALTQTAAVTATADDTAESGESVVLGFGALPEGIEAGATASATVTLADAAPANTAPTGLPGITGTPKVGEVLTASISDIEDADGLDNAAFAYQWLAHDGTNDSEIAGATGSTHEVGPAEVGKTLKVRVTFTDDGDTEERLTSVATEAVAARAPDAPGGLAAATAVGREGELDVTWTAPASDGGSEVSGYKVQWKSGSEAYDGTETSTPADGGERPGGSHAHHHRTHRGHRLHGAGAGGERGRRRCGGGGGSDGRGPGGARADGCGGERNDARADVLRGAGRGFEAGGGCLCGIGCGRRAHGGRGGAVGERGDTDAGLGGDGGRHRDGGLHGPDGRERDSAQGRCRQRGGGVHGAGGDQRHPCCEQGAERPAGGFRHAEGRRGFLRPRLTALRTKTGSTT